MGGLATALRLAHRGHRVTVLEKTARIGGRNRPAKVNGCAFDGGPTLLMMRAPFDRLFEDVGESIDAHLSLSRMEPSYRVFFRDGSRMEGTPDRTAMREQIRTVAGERDAEGFDRLLEDLASMYAEAIPRFVRRNFYSLADFLSPDALRSVAKHRMMGNLAKRIASYFRDPRLRMLFSFQTMYLGLSPFEAPWVYAVLAYMEYGEGIWYPQGGLVRLAEVIGDLAKQRGAEFRLGTSVECVRGGKVLLESGEALSPDAVIVNADLPYAENELLGKPVKKRRSSCSAVVTYLDYEGSVPELLHHNVFFGSDFRGNLEQIFNRPELPTDPAFYACISARSDPGKAPSGHENLMLLVPCPNLDRPWSDQDEEALLAPVYDRLERETSFQRGQVAGSASYGPLDYRDELNLDRGAAFGLSHHFGQSAFFRPSNRSRTDPNVYFVGASTVPGNGLPMVLISAELVEERLDRELGLAKT